MCWSDSCREGPSSRYDRQVTTKESVCCKKRKVAYFWRDCTGDHVEEHVEETVDKLMTIVQSAHDLNDYQSAECQAAFEDLLKVAQRGRLHPNEHVRTVQLDPAVDMYEMRWADLCVTPRDPLTGLYGEEVSAQMRLYYVETGQPWVVGLHCHEKEIFEGDAERTRAAQNEQIKLALSYHEAAKHRTWGVDVAGLTASA